MRRLLLILILALGARASYAQIAQHVTWASGFKKVSAALGVVMLKATLDEGWHIYSATTGKPDPTKTTIAFGASKTYAPVGNIIQPKPISKYFSGAKMTLSYFEGQVVFQQKVKLNAKTSKIKGTVDYIVCNDHTCLPPETFEFTVPVAI
ncbi:protein-disulfide reductase DsbD domain-containing protein [Mucilaginibacter myungsuensis]|uniref:Sugar transporter n=1 Tax=Mucilaginibacter myungsuensis TaxID=649104 RepID=A0A929PVZ1_9SPHI|nr:protein-disulfide reductase DsbD domain-containing protein [Mucilaginibacter myungsuensis]MBE9661624.1 sugar transporter [Mucilaginibacter myungsuensis]MDN3597768.1 protein-disulfide reductase DsbD family protein [Mucilaginibacter myungsuensis]